MTYDPADFQIDHDDKIDWMIESAGWAVEPVPPVDRPGERRPAYAYTIGLVETLGHPELAIFGLAGQPARGLLEDAAGHLSAGGPIPVAQLFSGLLASGLPCAFLPVPTEEHGHLFPTAQRRDGEALRVLQYCWPTPDGLFPWDDGYPAELRPAQPIIGVWDDPDPV